MTATTAKVEKYRSMRRAKMRSTIIYHTLVTIMSFLMLYPLFWMVSSSFKPNTEIFVNVTSLIPIDFTLENYITGWKGFAELSFAVFFKKVIRKVELQHHIAQIVRQLPIGRILRELSDLGVQISGHLAQIFFALHAAECKCLAADCNINIVFYSHLAALLKTQSEHYVTVYSKK